MKEKRGGMAKLVLERKGGFQRKGRSRGEDNAICRYVRRRNVGWKSQSGRRTESEGLQPSKKAVARGDVDQN